MKPRVFMINYAGHPLHNASDFGTLEPLTTGSVDKFNPDRFKYMVMHSLKTKKYNPLEDYILITSSSLLTYYTGHVVQELVEQIVAAGIKVNEIKVLAFLSHKRLYVERTISIKTPTLEDLNA